MGGGGAKTERIPACQVRGCPAPKDPDFHRCWCGQGEIEHHHVQSRGMGGSKLKRDVVALCHNHHEAVTLHDCFDIVTEFDWGKTYSYMDTNGEVLHTRPLEGERNVGDSSCELGGGPSDSRDVGVGGGSEESGKGLSTPDRTVRQRPLEAGSSKPQWDANLRFWPKVQKTDKCWIWVGCHDNKGYGQLRVDGRMVKAHRVSYELAHGPIPDGLTIDHLCRNHPCVNPTHLEAVTLKENILRGEGDSAKRARVTHCPKGHPYDEQNTKIRPKGWRECRTCMKASKLKHARARRARETAPSARAEAASPDDRLLAPTVAAAAAGRVAVGSASAKSSAAERENTAFGPIDPAYQGRSAAEPFSLETWRQEGERLAEMGHALRGATSIWQFAVGDWFVRGETVLGEEVYGHIDQVGFGGSALRQYAWVAAKVTPDTRVPELSYAHHRAVAAEEPPKQKDWLAKARKENMTSDGLYRAIHGEKPKVRRWTMEELREAKYGTEKQRVIIMAFLDWLEVK